MTIHEKLQSILEERGWSRYRLSKECGLSESTIANIFHRNTLPSIDTLETICCGFGITLSQFFAENDFVELTPDLKELFENWVYLSPTQKDVVLKMIKAMKNNE